jgi:hypothetical protein
VHETIEALSAYVDDEVSPAERSRIEAHLAACVDCTSRKTLLERASASLRTLPAPEPTMDEARRIREGVLRQTRRRPSARTRLWGGLRPVWAGAGALALVVVAVVVGSVLLRGQPRHSDTTAAKAGSPGAGAGTLAFANPRDVRSFVSADASVKHALDTVEARGPAEAGEAPAQGLTAPAAPMPQGPAVPGALRYGAKAPALPDAASASPAPPTTMQAPADSSRNELRAAAPERSSGDCLAERQEGRTDIRPAVARAATYAGKPAWLLVYAMPAPAPGGPEQVAVYLVGRADCGVLTYQVFGAP